jgi:hypothetical protein
MVALSIALWLIVHSGRLGAPRLDRAVTCRSGREAARAIQAPSSPDDRLRGKALAGI